MWWLCTQRRETRIDRAVGVPRIADEAQSTRKESGRHEEKMRIIGKEEGHAELPCFKAPTFEKKNGSLNGVQEEERKHVARTRSLVHLLPAVEIGHQTNAKKNYPKHGCIRACLF